MKCSNRLKRSFSPLKVGDNVELLRNIYRLESYEKGHTLYASQGDQGVILDIFTVKQSGAPSDVGTAHAKVWMKDDNKVRTFRLTSLKKREER